MTQYVLRDYQAQAVERTVQFMLQKAKKNGLVYMPTGSGKSLAIGTAAIELSNTAPVIIFQPTKEILEQNYEKIRAYGFQPEVFSASMGKRNIGEVTLATIGSVYKHPEWFEDFQFGIIDESHLVSAKDNSKRVRAGEDGQFYHRDLGLVNRAQNQEDVRKGKVRVIDDDGVENIIEMPKKSMYRSFFDLLPHMRLCGFTASPYRLESDAMGSQLKVITRTRPKIWDEFIHWTQNKELFDAGYLAKLEYHAIRGFKRSAIPANSTGAEFDEKAVQLHLWEKNWETKDTKKACNFADKLVEVVERLLAAGRRNALVFTSTIRESEYLAERMRGECAIVTGQTAKDEREATAREFRAGEIKVVTNVNCWAVGFDFPQLECVVLGSPTMSLARYYQQIGRGIRIHPEKESCWIVDMVESYEQFGPVESLHLYCQGNSRWDIFGRPGGKAEKQLTSTYLGGSALRGCCPKCHAPKIMAFYVKSGKWLPVSVPPGGRRGDLILKREGSKTICEMAERGQGTHSFHFKYCRMFAELRQSEKAT